METVCKNITSLFICLTVEVPQILFISSPATVYPGDSVNFLCKTTENPNTMQTIQWINPANQTLGNETNLRIFEVRAEDKGEYKCRVSNFAGSVYKTTTLNVLNPPEQVQIKLKGPFMLNDSDVCFVCKAGASDPPAQIQWSASRFGRNFINIRNSTSLLQSYGKGGHSVQSQMCFHVYKSMHDKMFLQCNVHFLNKHFEMKELQLQVEYAPFLDGYAVSHIRVPRNEQVQLSCPISPGKPYGEVLWLGINLKGGEEHYGVINTVFYEDDIAECCRKNIHGSMCFTYDITTVEPNIVHAIWPSSYYPKQGDLVSFYCKILHDTRLVLYNSSQRASKLKVISFPHFQKPGGTIKHCLGGDGWRK